MKISNSKKKLAEIIHENGGWRDGAESAAQCIKGEISFWHDVATKRRGEDRCGSYLGSCEDIEFTGVKLPNWHQTVLSRDEYFHLYPAPDADGWIEWNGGRKSPVGDGVLVDVRLKGGAYYEAELLDDTSWSDTWGEASIVAYRLHKPVAEPVKVVVENKTTCHLTVADKLTIEQLAADYRNAKDYAERKQREADAAKSDAEAKLAELAAAGAALGLELSVAGAEPELVISVQAGDEVECIKSNVKPSKYKGMIGTVLEVDDSSTPYLVDFDGEERIWCHEVKFIRRPAQGGAHA